MSETTTSIRFTYEQFENLCGPQLVGSSVPHSLWPTIYSKLDKQIFDAGEVFCLAAQSSGEDEEEEDKNEQQESATDQSTTSTSSLPFVLVAARDLAKDDVEDQAWLLDHAWTFRAKEARSTLTKNAELRARFSKMLLGRETGDVEEVLHAMWTHVGHYRVASTLQMDEESCWYLLDEVGTAITRTIDPAAANVAMAPLFYPPANAAFNIVWFINHNTNNSNNADEEEDSDEEEESIVVEQGEMITVDVGRGLTEERRELNKARFEAVWGDLLDDEETLKNEYTDKALVEWQNRLKKSAEVVKPKVDEILSRPLKNNNNNPSTLPTIKDTLTNGSPIIKVWTDHERIHDTLTLPNYKLVQDPDEADIAWCTATAVDPKTVNSNVKFVAEFHYENRFCNKLYLAKCLQETLGPNIPWLPLTFDATPDLPAFLGQYAKNKQEGEDNYWISKPHAMARSMDMIISNDPKLLCRIGETGPKILCKYVHKPATLRGRKFDLRLCALVRSFDPKNLEVYLHDKVWVRTAFNQYSQTDFDEYEKHFTVMNYSAGGQKLLNLLHDDFVAEFDQEKGAGKWAATFEKIKAALRQVFTAISVAAGADELETPFFGTEQPGKTVHRRALYGLDLMLTEDLEPVLLEITFSPDVNRACKFFPTFIDDVFKTLFEGIPTSVERLC